jgi:CRISPR-associated endonuclease Cas1
MCFGFLKASLVGILSFIGKPYLRGSTSPSNQKASCVWGEIPAYESQRRGIYRHRRGCGRRSSAVGSLPIRQRQLAAVSDPRKRLEVARKIVGAKLRTLGLHPADAAAFRAEIAGARSILDLMAAEARAGGAYFIRFRGSELNFLHSGETSIPDHWRVFIVRAAPVIKGLIGTSKARNAATPIGAMLNYAYTVALGQCTRACIGLGLDPCFGFLHVPRQDRLSLSYDILEFHRADLTSAVFDHVAKISFAPNAFELNNIGIVSLAWRRSPCGLRRSRRLAGACDGF